MVIYGYCIFETSPMAKILCDIPIHIHSVCVCVCVCMRSLPFFLLFPLSCSYTLFLVLSLSLIHSHRLTGICWGNLLNQGAIFSEGLKI